MDDLYFSAFSCNKVIGVGIRTYGEWHRNVGGEYKTEWIGDYVAGVVLHCTMEEAKKYHEQIEEKYFLDREWS